MLVVAVVAVVAAVSGGIAIAAGDGDDQPLSGSTLERASAGALAATGGGKVTETEVGDDGAAYEVEVTLADGSQVDVRLDDRFAVIGRESDDDGVGDRDGAGDD
jgi:uncharacterized membrane protein YkoI